MFSVFMNGCLHVSDTQWLKSFIDQSFNEVLIVVKVHIDVHMFHFKGATSTSIKEGQIEMAESQAADNQ